MRKLSLLMFAMLLCMPAFSKQKIRIEKVEPDSTAQEIVTYRTKANHWSLSGTLGIGMLDGDQKQPYSAIFPRSAKQLNFTLNLEYSFNPIWGLYLEYLHNPYAGTARYSNQIGSHKGPLVDFRGINHEGSLGVSLNLLNMFSTCRPQVFNWYGNVGLGVSLFKMIEHPNLNDDDHWLPSWETGRTGRSMSIPLGTTLEVNATRWLAILLNVQYRLHFQDTYDGSISGNQNDHTAYAGLGLRWKMNSLKHRNRDHVRNMSMCTWEQNASEKLAQDNAKRLDTLKGRVDYLDVRFKALEPRVRALENDMDKLRDSDGDGVPDIYDRSPNTPPNTPVNQYGEPIGEPGSGRGVFFQEDANNPINRSGSPANRPGAGSGVSSRPGSGSGVSSTSGYRPSNAVSDEEGLSVYFATGRQDISLASHNVLAAIARKLQAHPTYLIEIHGFADQQGERSNFQNLRLSENRAKKVRDTLINKYGVDARRVVLIKGHGAIEGPTLDYLPNRRADIFFVR